MRDLKCYRTFFIKRRYPIVCRSWTIYSLIEYLNRIIVYYVHWGGAVSEVSQNFSKRPPQRPIQSAVASAKFKTISYWKSIRRGVENAFKHSVRQRGPITSTVHLINIVMFKVFFSQAILVSLFLIHKWYRIDLQSTIYNLQSWLN